MRAIEGHGVGLRPLEERDLALTRSWRNRDDVRRWFFTADVITPEQHAAWWQRYRESDDDLVFVIEETSAARRPVGTISVYAIDLAGGRAELGRLLIGEPDAERRGLATKATRLLVDWCSGELGVRELRLEVLAANRRAIALYERCGFVAGESRDGRLSMRLIARSPQPPAPPSTSGDVAAGRRSR